MAGFSIKSLGPSHMAELLEDKGHTTHFDSFVVDQLIGSDNIEMCDRPSGTIDVAPIELTTGEDSVRSALVAPGVPTPIGNAKVGVMSYVINEYRKAYPLPQNIYGSSDAALRALERLMRTKPGLDVKTALEKEILAIFRAQGSVADGTGSTAQSLTGKEWNNISAPGHNPLKDILDAIELSGATKLFLGKNVANALKFSPKVTGSAAGSGTENVSDAQLIEKLLGLGLSEVWIAGHDWVNNRSLNLPGSLARLHASTAALWAEGSIVKRVLKPFQYDMTEDWSTQQVLFRATEHSVVKSVYPDSIIAFTNILT